jgi:hypothetical protein
VNFSLPYPPLSDICRCIDKMSDCKHVFFRQDKNNFRIYAKSSEFYADFIREKLADPSEFGFVVDSSQFVALIKKAGKKDIEFSVDKARMVISQGSLDARLPLMDTIIDFSNLTDLPRFDAPGFLDDLDFCARSVKDDKRFLGIVVESGATTSIAKIGFASCGTAQDGQYSFGNKRFVLSTTIAAILKGFDDEHKKSLLLNDNVFGVEFVSGVTMYSMLVADQLPQQIFELFGSPSGRSFVVNRKAVVDALAIITSVIDDEMCVRWDWLVDEKSWCLSSRTYKGASAAECVACDTGGQWAAFGLHRKALTDILKAFDKSVENVCIFPESGSFVYVTSGRYVAALTKMSL